jgi:hypothetical protein
MTDAAVTVDRLEPLEVLLQLAAQVAFDHVFVLGDDLDDPVELLVAQALGADIGADLGLFQDQLRPGRANAVNVGESGFNPFVTGNVDTKKAGQNVKAGSTLALFQARIFLVDDIDTALPADDLAVRSAAFDGSANSHD